MADDDGPQFAIWACICDHPSEWHDDGFGCTEDGCTCLAGWSW